MKKYYLLFFYIAFLFVSASSQEYFPKNGVSDERLSVYLIKGSTVFTDYRTRIQNTDLLIKGERIEAVGQNITPPEGAIIIDAKGKFIYPSFIDLYTQYGLKPVDKPKAAAWNSAEQLSSKRAGAHNANEAIKSDFVAARHFTAKDKEAATMRQLGFGAVLTFRPDGIARGTSALVSLGKGSDNELLLKPHAATHYSFDKGSSAQFYPISVMGCVALLRQTYFDAQWYKKQKRQMFKDNSLDAFNRFAYLPKIFETRSWLDLLRADKIGDEFGENYLIKSDGRSYHRVQDIKNANVALIVPLNFPTPYDVGDPLDAKEVSYEQMKHWELAPTNPAVLARNNIVFALTTSGLSDKTTFMAQLRKAIKHGLSEENTLKAITHTPAKLIGAENDLGSIQAGKIANFIITSANIFEEKTQILQNWVQGEIFRFKPLEKITLAGMYELSVGNTNYRLSVKEKLLAPDAKIIVNDTTSWEVQIKQESELISICFNDAQKSLLIRLSGWLDPLGNMKGIGQNNDTWINWTATRKSEQKQDQKKEVQSGQAQQTLGKVIYPFVAYGNEKLPSRQDILFKNATVWTNESDGILPNTDVLVQAGKISRVGKNLTVPARTLSIDATGKHLTSGIIDEHSHIALSNVNDFATIASMCRMEDAVDPTDINIYRQLSGGVTAAQLLHGSANPVGGQSAIVKMRWGVSPQQMLIQGAARFIKFALGENVKRSSNPSSIRYPQTRMGVEQVYRDGFERAKSYDQKWKTYNKFSSREKEKINAPRKDLMLEAMAEILSKKRFISCHSYVQSEINMLMHVAEDFGFRINTFTHILEGYKVADKMQKHGVGGSTFSDWWAYKSEVQYAIPYNAALMHGEGVLTAINSDNAEMGRRLNQEAAKSIKYGNMSAEDAWKMVTLNPAKLLHLDDRMGSIKKGKDADLVLWSDHPLSVYAKAEKTLVDGIVYYDRERDRQKQEAIEVERARLIEKMLQETKEGKPTQKPKGKYKHHWHCDHLIKN